MGIEALKQQLAEGKITQEQFEAELKKLLDAGAITQEEHDAALKPNNGGGDDPEPLTAEQVQAMIADAVAKAEQSAGDKVRTEYAAKLKKEQEEKERLLKEKMTDEEKAKYEKEQFERELKEKEAALNAREVALHVVDKLSDPTINLPLSFKTFFEGAQSTEDADNKIAILSAAWNAEIKAAVEAKFKENGDDPSKNKKGPKAKKWNDLTLTEQGQLYKENPDEARKLAAEAGIELA